PLLALAAAQIGLVLMFEARVRRWLERRVPWAATILVNGMIMTVFLWHSTVMMLLVGLAFWVVPGVLAQQPDTTGWWLTRPIWLFIYALVTLPFLLVFGRFERPAAGSSTRPAAVWLQLLGCTVACAGLAMLALDGVGGDGWLGLRWIPLLTPLVGAGLAGVGPFGSVGRGLSGAPRTS
ncbi:MAG: acyltransferase, partial [Acidobacteriota bacterium]|nr:acyltransferase [Acidobacteriota bacterium]